MKHERNVRIALRITSFYSLYVVNLRIYIELFLLCIYFGGKFRLLFLCFVFFFQEVTRHFLAQHKTAQIQAQLWCLVEIVKTQMFMFVV